ncbi:MAG: hypothetical protein ABJP82_24325, partial [Hyphomicrobiales bacterium]
LRQLALYCKEDTSSTTLLETVSQYIGIVGVDGVLPPAAIIVPNTYKQAMDTPQPREWEKAMQKEMQSLDEHEVADLIPSESLPPGSHAGYIG